MLDTLARWHQFQLCFGESFSILKSKRTHDKYILYSILKEMCDWLGKANVLVNSNLADNERFADLERAAKEAEFRNRLLEEF